MGNKPQLVMKRMSKVRKAVYCIIVLALGILYYVVFSDIRPTMEYDPNNWVRMSIALGASMLTVVGIFASIMTSDENSKRAEFTDIQDKIKEIVEGRERYMPEGELKEQYKNTLNKINMLIEERAPLRFRQSYVGFGSFFLFLFSAMSAIFGLEFKIIWFFFLGGVGLIIGYISDCIIEFDKMDRDLTEPARSSARLEIPNIMVNDQECILYYNRENDQKLLLISDRINVLNIPINFQGIVRNGFLHAIITYVSNEKTYIPHRDTFLMGMGFVDNYRLAIYEGQDTGVLNFEDSEDEISLTFNIPLRIRTGTEGNKLLRVVDLQYLGKKDVYEHPYLSDDFRVIQIALRMMEDPFYRPKRKRREIAGIIINVERRQPTSGDLLVKTSPSVRARAAEPTADVDEIDIQEPSFPSHRWEFLWFTYTGDNADPWGNFIKRTFKDDIKFDDKWEDGEVGDTGEWDYVGFRASRTEFFDKATYIFKIGGDDGIRLSVRNMDSVEVLNISKGWKDQGYTISPGGEVTLPEGDYKILLEWYECMQTARASFNIIKKESKI